MKHLQTLGILLAFLGLSSQAPSGPKNPGDLAAVMKTQPQQDIKALDSGQKIPNPDPWPTDLGPGLALETQRTYYYQGKTLTSTFQVLYLGLQDPTKNLPIQSGDTLGKAQGVEVKLLARSKILDPYLVGSTPAKPIKVQDYYYYSPGVYLSASMKFLAFKPFDLQEYQAMKTHALEEMPGSATFLRWWTLLPTELAQFPAPVSGSDQSQLDQEFQGIKFHLTFQKGFLDYLKKEYTLGQRIYLYLQVTGINNETEGFDAWVRDFSLISPDQVVQDRLKENPAP